MSKEDPINNIEKLVRDITNKKAVAIAIESNTTNVSYGSIMANYLSNTFTVPPHNLGVVTSILQTQAAFEIEQKRKQKLLHIDVIGAEQIKG